MPKAAGTTAGNIRSGESGRRRATRHVHDVARQPGEGQSGAEVRVSEKRREALPRAEDARTEVLLHAPGDGGCASDEVQPAGAGGCELNPSGAYQNSPRAG